MKRRLAGRLVLPVALGTMNLAGEGRPSRAEAVRVIHAALDAGVEVIDTADAYALGAEDGGYAEGVVREALASWRVGPAPLVATKGGVVRTREGGWVHDGRPEHLARACEASLRALGVERIDLYQLHAVDERVPIAESVGALVRLREMGKVGAIGVSNVSVAALDRTLDVEREIASVQNEASVYVPGGIADGVLARCEERGIAFLAYAPVGGWRAGRIAHEVVLREIAEEAGATAHEVAIAWVLGASDAVIAVAGASREANARSCARVGGLRLSVEQRERVGRLAAAAQLDV